MLNKTIFAQNMAGLCEVYNRELTKTLQNIYYAILKDMQDDDFKQAIKRLLQERVFATFPKPAEILSLSNVKKVMIVEVDEIEEKAKELIEFVHSAYLDVEREHAQTGIDFDSCLKALKFNSLSKEDEAVLNNVKPYKNLKTLVKNINAYATSLEQVKAFKNALQYQPTETLIESVKNMRIGRWKEK